MIKPGLVRLGLIGSIGMGKSTIAGMFRDEGVPVWDADDAVHRLYAQSDAVKTRLVQVFGDVLTDGVVDRAKLSQALKAVPDGFDTLNAIVHPATVVDREAFLAQNGSAPLTVSDIPLLFETGADKAFDAVLVVSAPADIQRQRVLARPGMTAEKFTAILARQMPDDEKRRRADFAIDTSQTLDACREAVRAIIRKLTVV